MYCTQLAENTGRKNRQNIAILAPLCRAVSSQLRHISKKNLLNSNISSTCLHNMMNFGPLTADICWRVWGTPANFSGFRVLAALGPTAWHFSSGRQPNFAALNRGRHLYSAGRPSRWALAHILVSIFILLSWININRTSEWNTETYDVHIFRQ